MIEIDEDILTMFAFLEQEKSPVKFLNAYKGSPIYYPAAVVSIFRPYRIRFQVHKYQTLCLHRERETTIMGDAFPGYMRARVDHLDIASRQVDLVEFEYNEEKMVQRVTERVIPREPLAVWITLIETKFKMKCEITDISTEGLAFLLPIEFYAPNRFRRGEEILLSFELPPVGRGQAVEIRGKGMIRNTMGAADQDKKRVGVRMHYFDPQNQALIAQYIQVRMQEIVREMDITYAALARLSQPGNPSSFC